MNSFPGPINSANVIGQTNYDNFDWDMQEQADHPRESRLNSHHFGAYHTKMPEVVSDVPPGEIHDLFGVHADFPGPPGASSSTSPYVRPGTVHGHELHIFQ